MTNATENVEATTDLAGRPEQVVTLPATENRIETGAIRFGDDWPGVFIRGDDAAYYALTIDTLMKHDKNDPAAIHALAQLWTLLVNSKAT